MRDTDAALVCVYAALKWPKEGKPKNLLHSNLNFFSLQRVETIFSISCHGQKRSKWGLPNPVLEGQDPAGVGVLSVDKLSPGVLFYLVKAFSVW